MISRRSADSIRRACGFIALGMGPDALQVLARLDPQEHEAAPVLAVRVQAHAAAKQWPQVLQLAGEVIELLRKDPANVGPVGELVLYELSTYYATSGKQAECHNTMSAAAALEAARAVRDAEFADPRARALWDIVAAAHCSRIEPNGWPDDGEHAEK